ncbi:MAG: hypothetical protein DRJ03_18190 [Chloroflexi bacterium]|nr:MAG: hypothetical protein DRJ03_18190 [Chloroflexota bacterium]RLI52376.1 MAG: hypothetical protein DRP09_18050 [Candidatus Thorarchaeota archaeon]
MWIYISTWFNKYSTSRWTVICFFLFWGIYSVFGIRLMQVYEVTGDEPQYLLIAHSLAYDGDIDLANNFEHCDYRTYFSHELDPAVDHQAIDFLGNGVILSKHDIGLPLLIAPFYRIAGRVGVVIFQNIVTAWTIALCFKWVYRHVGRWAVAMFVCLGIGFSIPTLPFSAQVYPETVAALFILLELYQLDPLQRSKVSNLRLAGYSAVASFLPWLSIKYVVVSAVLAIAGVYLLLGDSRRRQLWSIVSFVAPALFFVLLWIYIRIRFYGTLSPVTQYADFQFSFAFIYQHALGMLMDQEHGLLPYSPMYVLAPVGLVIMWRARQRFMALLIAMTFVVFFGLIASWHCWWGGWCFPARFLTVVLPILALPIAYVFDVVSRRGWLSTPLLFLAIGLILISVFLGFFGMDDPVYRLLNRRDGAANLFLDLGPRSFDWASVLPSYPPASPVVRFLASDTASDIGDDVMDLVRGNGTVRFAPYDSPPGYLVREAREMIASGRYRVCAEISTDGNSTSVGTIEAAIISHRPKQIVFELPVDDLTSPSFPEYQWKCGELWLDHRDLIGFSFWFTGVKDVYLRTLSYERLGPWSPALYTVTGSLDLTSDNVAPYLGEGWSMAEAWGRWAIGHSSLVYVHLDKRIDTLLTANVFPYYIEGEAQHITVYYNDQLLDRVVLPDAEAREFSIIIPGSLISRDVDVLRFDYGYTWSPAEGDLGGDQRALAVGFVGALKFSLLP